MTTDTTLACPECDDTTDLNQRTRHPDRSERWRCRGCGATFAEPRRREIHRPGGGRLSDRAQALADANPDEYP